MLQCFEPAIRVLGIAPVVYQELTQVVLYEMGAEPELVDSSGPAQQQQLGDSAPVTAPFQCPLMLTLPGAIESNYVNYLNASKYTQDWWGTLCYLAMDAPGLVTTILAATVLPGLWNTGLEGCVIMTTTTIAVLVIHLALMLLLKPAAYIANRGPIITAVRMLCMLSAIIRGLQHCSTVTKWVDGVEMESPLSAFLWRTGIIALLWHGSTFRLPFC